LRQSSYSSNPGEQGLLTAEIDITTATGLLGKRSNIDSRVLIAPRFPRCNSADQAGMLGRVEEFPMRLISLFLMFR